MLSATFVKFIKRFRRALYRRVTVHVYMYADSYDHDSGYEYVGVVPLKGGGNGDFHLILFLRSSSGCRIFSRCFHCQTGACRSTFTCFAPSSKAYPVAVDWGGALRDFTKGTIADRVYIMYGERLPYSSYMYLYRLES